MVDRNWWRVVLFLWFEWEEQCFLKKALFSTHLLSLSPFISEGFLISPTRNLVYELRIITKLNQGLFWALAYIYRMPRFKIYVFALESYNLISIREIELKLVLKQPKGHCKKVSIQPWLRKHLRLFFLC